ncbi:hypothetical protein QJS10_CPB19g00344 [Acorus calamus]|uniref:Uncharacterized protein n=1 Tax=Acorus calamus TaxID=4465 RepID=A0AAV9CEU6_ACOCL|nr:hypothetical protein QJS10_CPB19g00344 [Acorus calamus]
MEIDPPPTMLPADLGVGADAAPTPEERLHRVLLPSGSPSRNLQASICATAFSVDHQLHSLREACEDDEAEHLSNFISGYRMGYSDHSRGFREMSNEELPTLFHAVRERRLRAVEAPSSPKVVIVDAFAFGPPAATSSWVPPVEKTAERTHFTDLADAGIPPVVQTVEEASPVDSGTGGPQSFRSGRGCQEFSAGPSINYDFGSATVAPPVPVLPVKPPLPSRSLDLDEW